MVDTTAPTITILGDAVMNHELGDTYNDAGVLLEDLDPRTVTLVTTGSVNESVLDTYEITYTATDASGNSATATRTVFVTDTTGPTVTVVGDNPVTVELGDTYTDAGVLLEDLDPRAITLDTTNEVDVFAPGEYTVTYTATDSSGNATTATRTVNVVDTTAPTITILGDAVMNHELGDTYNDAGVLLEDLDPRTVTLVTTGSVNESVLDTYEITYTATDASGNSATATRTVFVTDTTGPTVTVVGGEVTYHELGYAYEDAGVLLEDLDPRTITLVTSYGATGEVDGGTLDTYEITYTATDSSGNATTVTRVVFVTDTLAPVFVSSPYFTVNEGATNVGLVVSNDVDPRSITFTIESSLLQITEGGYVSFIQPADYEGQTSNPVDLPYDGSTYDITATVTATDSSGNAGYQDITVSINDVGGIDDNTATGTGTNTASSTGVGTGSGTGSGSGSGSGTGTS